MNFIQEINNRYLQILQESKRQAKNYVVQGKLSDEDYNRILEIDPSNNNKYSGWMAKQWISGGVGSFDELTNTITEFDTLVKSRRLEKTDITAYKSFSELKDAIQEINDKAEAEEEKRNEITDTSDLEIVVDNEDLLIVVPHTHAVSREIGLNQYACRGRDKELNYSNPKDAPWCTTWATDEHFNNYYYKMMLTFYYIKVKSEKLKNSLPEEQWMVVVAIDEDGDVAEGGATVDAKNNSFDYRTFLNTIGIE